MMSIKSVLIILISIFQFKGYTQVKTILFEINENHIIQYHSNLRDEFTGSVINDDLWYDHYPWGGVSLGAQIYTSSEMTALKNGNLHLSIDSCSRWFDFPSWMLDTTFIRTNKVEVRDGKVKMNYLTSAIWSKEKFKYGYFECKCKMPDGKGYWPAFWLYGGEPNEEIDFMEGKGERLNQVHVDVHCPNQCDRIKKYKIFDQPFGHWVKFKDPLINEWVHFAGKWTPQGVSFYINGKWVAAHEANFNTSMNLIANFSLAQNKGPFSPGPSKKTKFPADFLVDYMRIWSWEEPLSSLNISLSQEPSKFISCTPFDKEQFYIEHLGEFKGEIELEIYKDNKLFLTLDASAENQWVNMKYWPKGKYELVCRSSGKEKKSDLIVR